MIGLLDWLSEPRSDRGIKVAMADGGWSFRSYAELQREVLGTAQALQEHRLPRGTIVSLMLSEEREFVAALFACLLSGCTPAPIVTPLSFRDPSRYVAHAASILRASGPGLILSDESLAHLAEEAAGRAGVGAIPTQLELDQEEPVSLERLHRPAADLALLQFTSGSTGTPKGVRVGWDSLESNLHAIQDWLHYRELDATATWLPLYHDMGLIGTLLAPLVAGSNRWQMSPVDFVRAPERWLECFGCGGATIAASPAFGLGYTARRVRPEQLDGMDFSGFRVLIIGSDRVDPKILSRFVKLLEPFGFDARALAPAYGLAEATLAVTGASPGRGATQAKLHAPPRQGSPLELEEAGLAGREVRAGEMLLASSGRPLKGTTVRIVAEQEELPEGHLGEVVISGSSLAEGYQPAPGENLPFPTTGLHTGDAGFLFGGELYVLGRIGDSVKVRGKSVYAEDAETELSEVEGISPGRCAVAFGSGGDGEAGVLVVESEEVGWLEEALGVLRRLTGSSLRVMAFQAERGMIPRTSSGKTRRRLMWQAALAGELPGRLLHDDAEGASLELERR